MQLQKSAFDAYHRGIVNGTFQYATPNVVRSLLDVIQTLQAEVEEACDDLVHAQNQIHGIKHGATARKTIAATEKRLRKAAAFRKE